MNTILLCLGDNLVCLSLKFLNFKVCNSNLTVENLQILNFIKIIKNSAQVINQVIFFAKTKIIILIYFKTIMYYGNKRT